MAGTVVLISNRLDRSRFGRAWVAIREDEIAARSLGISLMRTKILAFATGAAFAGAMGAIFAAKQLFVSPESFTFLQSVTILVMVLLVEQNAWHALKIAHRGYVLETGSIVLRGTATALAADRSVQESYLGGA